MKLQKLKEGIEREQFYNPLFNWHNEEIYEKYNFSNKFIEDFSDKIDFKLLLIYQLVPLDLIEKYKDKIDFTIVSKYQKLSSLFIKKYLDELDFTLLILNNYINLDLLSYIS